MRADQTAGSGRVKITQFLGKVPYSVVLWKEAARVHTEYNVLAARSPIFTIVLAHELHWKTECNFSMLSEIIVFFFWVGGGGIHDAEYESGTK